MKNEKKQDDRNNISEIKDKEVIKVIIPNVGKYKTNNRDR
jgi:hypothetical protein